ncbi:MAG TPA: response regulator [Thermoflexia bacterium]|nr:response regulator [Thermoflexia bacterium]
MTKILVAEDERDIRDLIAFTLRFAGFEVELAMNGQEAVEKAMQVKPDLILMDVRMPKQTGYEACRVLKTREALVAVPVVFLSAKGQESEISKGMSVGGTDYILKPFAPDDLIKQVRRILAEHGNLA